MRETLIAAAARDMAVVGMTPNVAAGTAKTQVSLDFALITAAGAFANMDIKN